MRLNIPKGFTFRFSLLVFSLVVAGILGGVFLTGNSVFFWGLVLPILFFLGSIAYGSAVISSGFFVPAICKGNPKGKQIAITFDDGPHEVITPHLLDILKAHDTPATFFCIGKNVEGREALVKRIVDEGHLIGNHTWNHSYYWGFSMAKAMRKELLQTQEALLEATGKKVRFFRPPFGVTTPEVNKAVKSLGYDVVGWSVRSLDAVLSDEDKIFERVTRELESGDIVLFHDVRPRTVRVLERFLDYIKTQDFTVVPLDQLTNRQAYE
ncbi:polysaccharide deacetylase family protein [bacterium]|nr:polysaccharide deacetylase family protein [bacterium]